MKTKQEESDIHKQYYKTHCEEIKKRRKHYYKNHREEEREKQRRYRKNNTEKERLRKLRDRATREGIPYNLSVVDIIAIESDTCRVCSAVFNANVGYFENSRTLDRVIPSLGYVRGNISFICARCNRIKNDGTLQEHQQIVDYMRNHADTSVSAKA